MFRGLGAPATSLVVDEHGRQPRRGDSVWPTQDCFLGPQVLILARDDHVPDRHITTMEWPQRPEQADDVAEASKDNQQAFVPISEAAHVLLVH